MEKNQCVKCGYVSEKNHEKFGVSLCSICYFFSPGDEKLFEQYVNEKVDGNILETFRKHFKPAYERQKNGMIKKASLGELMSRAPLGYKTENKKLVPADNFREIEKIFEEFLNEDISLTQLAKRYNLSVNGLKKILTNFTYIGKIKFNNEIHNGSHQPIVSSTLFNHVQNKLEKLGIK